MTLATTIYLLAILNCWIHITEGTFPPNIDKFPDNDVTLKRGVDYKMQCKDTAEKSAKTIWYKVRDGIKIPITFGDDDRVITNANQDLIFINPQPDKHNPTGHYTCTVKNQYGEKELGYDLKITLAYFEDEFRYTPRDSSFYDIPGSNLAWGNCLPPKSHPQIIATYINGSSGLPVNTDDKRVTLRQLTRNGIYTQIIIENATKADAGRWVCVAKHPTLGEKRYEFNIEFYGPPPGPKNIRIKESRATSVVLNWDYVRNDLSFYEIELTKKEDSSKKIVKMKESKSPRLQQLLSFEVSGLDAGKEYTIKMRATDIKNQLGEWSNIFEFTSVSELKPILVVSPKEKTRVGERKETSILCRIDALPFPTFKWFKDGKELQESDEILIKDGLLTLKNVKRGKDGSEGMYKCKATNKLGSAESKEGKLLVEWIEDKFQSAPGTRFFYATDDFIRVSSRPPKGIEPIDIVWRQAGQRITKKTHPLFSPTLYQGPRGNLFQALDIRTPTIVQSDIYHITASNLAKAVTVEFRLILAPPPLKPTVRLSKTMHGTATVKWSRPKTIERIKKLGFLERNDISRYDVWFRKESDTSSNGTTVEHFEEENAYRITGLEIDVSYVARVRAVDYGDQAGSWSSLLKFKLDKNLPPAIITGPPKESSGIENKTHTLPCKVSAHKSVIITWFKDGNAISKKTERHKYMDDGGLELSDIQRSMTGVYHCKATTSFGSTESIKGKFNVVYLDSTFIYTRRFTGVHKKKGFTDARVLCIPPKSYPEASVYWSNDTEDALLDFGRNSRIKREDKYVRDGVTYHSLIIKNAVELVGQKYGCVVINSRIGNKVFYIANSEITIYGNPDPPEVKYRLSSPKSIIAHWISERDDIVNFDVTIKNGDKVVKTLTTPNKEVKLNDLPIDVLYTFEVVAIDVASQKSKSGVVSMAETKPSIFKDLKSGQPEIFEGNEYIMECQFYGFPFPTVKWTKNGQDISSDVQYTFMDANRKIKIASLNHKQHNGKYQCVATNKVGKSESSVIDIKVIYTETTFQYAGTDKKFINRAGLNKVSFGCSPPLSYPPLDINTNYLQWLVNGRPVTRLAKKSRVEKDGIQVDLLEFEAGPSDVGVYSCVYPHKAGTRKHDMKLQLKDGPRKPIGLALKTISWNFFTMTWQHAGDVIFGYEIRVFQNGVLFKFANFSQVITEYTVEDVDPLTPYVFSLSSVGKETNSLPVTLMVNTTKRPNIGKTSEVVNIQKLNVGSTKVTITWEVPLNLNNNHPRKLKYDVKICIGTDCSLPAEKISERKVEVNELSPSTTYQIEITVYNEIDVMGPTARDFVKTRHGSEPPAISNFIANPSWNSIIVSWKPPHDTEIGRISHFILRIYYPGKAEPQDKVVSRDRSSYFFLDLTEGNTYRVGIFSQFNGRNGPLNELTVKTTDLGSPGLPKSIRVDSSENPGDANRITIEFQWELPLQLAGNPIDEIQYRIKLCDFEENCETKKTFLRDMNFDNKKAGLTYRYVLTTLRADGKDGESHRGEYNSDIGKISAPVSPTQVKSPSPTNMVVISWATPLNLGGHHINSIKYKIDYCLKQNGIKFACKSKVESGTTTSLFGLISGTYYYVSVRALTSIGIAGVPVEIVTRTDGISPPTTEFITTTKLIKTTEGDVTTTKTTKISSGGGGKKEVIVKEPLSTGVIIGIVLAVTVFAILVSAGIMMYMKKTKRGLHSTGQQKRNYIVEVEMNRRRR